MREISEIVDNLITKTHSEISNTDVRFIKEYRDDMLETPLTGYLAVVSIESMSRVNSFLGNKVYNGLNGEKFTADVSVKIYAPDYQNGQGLTGVTADLCDSLKIADEEKIIEEIKIEPIGFDSNVNAMFRVCKMRLSFYLCQEVKI